MTLKWVGDIRAPYCPWRQEVVLHVTSIIIINIMLEIK